MVDSTVGIPFYKGPIGTSYLPRVSRGDPFDELVGCGMYRRGGCRSAVMYRTAPVIATTCAKARQGFSLRGY